jgi:glycosyltransferase involved in cell wall biosynthesis
VSILLPVRNASESIGYAMESLLGQSYAHLEILVADDASTDATPELLRARYGSEARVRLFRSPVQQGPYNLKNGLARHARGELLAFHDADDLALPYRVASQVAALDQSHAQACIGNGSRVRSSGEIVFFKDQRATRLSPVSLLLSRRMFEELGGFRKVWVGADQELLARLPVRYGPSALARLRQPLVLSAWGDDSLTRSAGMESLEDGYRAPVRRMYSELVYQRYMARDPSLTDAAIDDRLAQLGNRVAPAELQELSASA